jgi:hypothetical protein
VTIVVADFDVGGAKPTSRDLVDAAHAGGATFVAVDVVDGDDETPDAHVGERRVAKLERLRVEAARRDVGLYLRLRDTLSVFGLRDALGVAKGASSATLRGRFLVVVDAERVGKRLRHDAPELPSALELSPAKRRGLARLMSPNFLRAAADADDLVVPWDDGGAEKLVVRIAPDLAKRGARVWIAGLRDADLARAALLPVAGCVVRRAFDGG